jgi:hypothetical protein
MPVSVKALRLHADFTTACAAARDCQSFSKPTTRRGAAEAEGTNLYMPDVPEFPAANSTSMSWFDHVYVSTCDATYKEGIAGGRRPCAACWSRRKGARREAAEHRGVCATRSVECAMTDAEASLPARRGSHMRCRKHPTSSNAPSHLPASDTDE